MLLYNLGASLDLLEADVNAFQEVSRAILVIPLVLTKPNVAQLYSYCSDC